jgi:small subunit ribosomal protein S20
MRRENVRKLFGGSKLANIKSQIKRNRQNDKRRLANRVYRGEARIAVKNARNTIEEGVPESKEALAKAISTLDKAAEKGVIHKNNAARRKSRLVKAFAAMKPVEVKVEEPKAEAPVVEEPKKKPAVRKTAAAPKKEATPKAKAAPKTKAAPKAAATRKKTSAKK